jgi:hypothetical protein
MKAFAILAAVFIPTWCLLTPSAKAISCNGVNYFAVNERYTPTSYRVKESLNSILGNFISIGDGVNVDKFSYPGYGKICISSLP